jgi:hypothetical protein
MDDYVFPAQRTEIGSDGLTQTRDDTPKRYIHIDGEDTLRQSGSNLNGANDTDNPGGNPLRELKSIVLSLDWEITDEVMDRFLQEIQRLEHEYGDEKILVSFLHLLKSIGKYIRIHKGKAHPHAGKLLNSAYMSLEKVIRSEDLTPVERKRMLARELKRYRRLKEQIALKTIERASERAVEGADKARPIIEQQQAASSIEEKSEPPGTNTEGFQGPGDMIEMFAGALEELKQFIHGEFRALREELKEWRKT